VKELLGDSKIKKILGKIAETASLLQQKGWAERNAGNISVNITDILQESTYLNAVKKFKFKSHQYPGLANNTILLTTSGSRMRDLSKSPSDHLCFLSFDKNGKVCQLIDRSASNPEGEPTSELPTHLIIHQMLAQNHRKEKAILHTHPNELIALTHIEAYNNEESLNHLIWSMHPESIMFIPQGVGLVPYSLSGTEELAMATIQSLNNHPVIIWEKHGCMAIGNDPLEAFDLIDIVSKSASIYFLCKSAGHTPEGISMEQIQELRRFSM